MCYQHLLRYCYVNSSILVSKFITFSTLLSRIKRKVGLQSFHQQLLISSVYRPHTSSSYVDNDNQNYSLLHHPENTITSDGHVLLTQNSYTIPVLNQDPPRNEVVFLSQGTRQTFNDNVADKRNFNYYGFFQQAQTFSLIYEIYEIVCTNSSYSTYLQALTRNKNMNTNFRSK